MMAHGSGRGEREEEPVVSTVTPLSSESQDGRESLEALAERRASALNQIRQLATALSRTSEEEAIVDELCRVLQRAVGDAGVVLALTEDRTSRLTTVRHSGPDGEKPLFDLSAEDGALADAIRSGTTRLVVAGEQGNAEQREAIDATLGEMSGANSLLVAPMMQGRKLVGVIIAYAQTGDAFDDETCELVTTLGIIGGAAFRSSHLNAESEKERRQSDAMAEIARALGESLRVGDVQRLILRHAMALLRGDGACIALRDGDYLHIEGALGIADVLAGVFIPVSGSLSGHVVEHGESFISNDVASEPRAYRRNLQLVKVSKAVIVPLVTVRGTIGALAVYNRDTDFAEPDARILRRLADQVALAIVNARLFSDIQEATREWSSTFEAIGTGMVVVDDQMRVMRCNARAHQLAGQRTAMTVLGRPFYQVLLGHDPLEGDDPLRAAIERGARSRGVVSRSNDGASFAVFAAPHPDGGAVVTFDSVDQL